MKIKNNTKNLIPQKQIGELIPKYRPGSSFSRAFAQARKQGLKTFMYDGKSYGTQLASEVNETKHTQKNKIKHKSSPYDSEALKKQYVVGEAWLPTNTDNARQQLNGKIRAGVAAMKANGATTEECAEWANDVLLNAKYSDGTPMYSMTEVGGDAWNRASAGKNQTIIYDGFSNIPMGNYQTITVKTKDGKTYKDMRDPKAIAQIRVNNKRAVDDFYRNFRSSTLDPNKTYIATMAYYNSPNVGKAYAQRFDSNKTNITATHTGNVYFEPKSGRWRVQHNIHGKLYDDDLIAAQGTHNGLGYGITTISEPRKNLSPTQRKKQQLQQQKKRQQQQAQRQATQNKANATYKANHPIVSRIMDRNTANRWFGWTSIKFNNGGYFPQI